jgi:SAM-dependent methyltransferase
MPGPENSIARVSLDPREIVRDGYDRASHAYRGDALELGARSGYAHWLRRIERRLAPGSRILDLGCGNGIPVARELVKRHRVTGLDLSLVQVRRARALVPEALFVCADMTQVGFAPASFEAVTAFFSIINVPFEEQPRLFEHIASWLIPGGWLLAVVGKHRRTAVEEDFRGVEGAAMYWSYGALYEYQRWITRAGFAIVEEGTQPQRSPSGFAVVIARRGSA